MEPRPDRTRELFAAALELPAAERRGWLENACAGEGALLARVWELIEAHERAGSFLADPGADVRRAAAVVSDEQPGDSIGAYKLLENIGEGGFGTVWMAEQREPVRRLVALKLLKAGMDSKQVVARFEQERQALALMTHPNIAQVFDAGTTERGRPFFVMELVKGVPITDYCAREKLPVRARLDLFVQVCRAVQHAHGKGLIHRDLKPRNVLVATADARPLAKVIDFGIAKATGARLTEATLFTEHRAMVGTLEYMSPEQAEGLLDVDTRSDVYSLGALLYELLTGSTPFDSKELIAGGYAEILRMLRDVEPQRPSVRVSSKGGAGWARGAVSAAKSGELFGVLKGDLDWVVMKALEKDRARRYASADGLAEDVERYLAGEAVRAVPPSVGYRVRKFVRKNRALVVGGGAVGAVLLLGVSGTTWGMLEADRNRLVAEHNEHRLRTAADKAATTLSQAFGGRGFSLQVSEGRGRDLQVSGPEQDLARIEVSFDTLVQKIEDQVRSLELEAYRANLNSGLAYAKAESPGLAAPALARCPEDQRGWEWRYVTAECAEQARVLVHRMAKRAAWDLSFDGTQVAAISDAGVLSVFRTESWAREVDHALGVQDVGFVGVASADRLVLGTPTSTLLLDLPTCSTIRSLPVALDGYGCCSYDRHWIAEIDDDKSERNDDTLTIWDVTTGRIVVQAHMQNARALSYSHDGRFVACSDEALAFGEEAARTRIWRSSDGALALEVEDGLTLNPYGPLSCSSRGRVVDPAHGTITPWTSSTDYRFDSYVDADHVLMFHPGKGAEGEIELRRIADGTEVVLPSGARRRPYYGGSTVTPDLARLYGNWVESVNGVSLVVGEDLPLEPFQWWQGLRLSATGKWWVGVDSFARLMAMSARPPRHTRPGDEPILALGTFRGGGPKSVGRSRSRALVIDEFTAARTESPVDSPAASSVVGCQQGTRFLLQRPSGLTLVDAGTAETLAGWDDLGTATSIALSHDGSLAACCDGVTVHVCRVGQAGGMRHLPLGEPVAAVAAMSITEGQVAIASGRTVRLLSTTSSGQAQQAVAQSTVTRLLFQPDGSRLLVGTDSGTSYILGVPDLAIVAELRGHEGQVTALAWTPTGDRAFTAGADGSVRVWHAQSPTSEAIELLSLSEPNIAGKPTCLLFPHDGERLICGYDDGAIRVWDSVPWSERVDRRNAAAHK